MSYEIELNEQRYKPRQTTSLHLITGFAMAGIGAFTFLLADTNWIQTVFHAPIIPGAILGSISLLYGLALLFLIFTKNKTLLASETNKKMRIANTFIAGLLAIIFVLSQWWLAAGISGIVAVANLFAYFYEQKITQALYVVFDEQNIFLPATSRKKLLEWTEVERVILRHGTITIDCTNNFLYQWTVKHNNLDQAAFEGFCAAHIQLNIPKRAQDEW